MRYIAAFVIVGLLHSIVLCRELPNGSKTKVLTIHSIPRPKLTLLAPRVPEKEIEAHREDHGETTPQQPRAEQHPGDPSGFVKVVEPAGEVQSERLARRGVDRSLSQSDIVPPLSIEWPLDPSAIDEIIRQFDMVVLAIGHDGKVLGYMPSVADSYPPQPWTGTTVAMSNRVRTVLSSGRHEAARLRVLVPAKVDTQFVNLQANALATIGLSEDKITQQTAAFQKTPAGVWEFVITESIPR